MAMLAAVALFTPSCESSDDDGNDYELSGSKYVGTLSILGTDQTDIVFYADESDSTVDIMMPEVSFMQGLMPSLDMALIDIAKISSDPNIYYSSESQIVGIYDHLPLINDVIQSITNVKVVSSKGYIEVSFDCGISTTAMGDMTVPVEYVGYSEDYVSPEFTLNNEAGFYITTSSGAVLLSSASVAYYEGNNALVIDGFSYSAYLATTTLPIVGVTSAIDGSKLVLTADDLAVSYTFMTMAATGTISGLTCEIIDGKAQMVFTISASMGGSGTATDYPCTFNGDITINTGSYTAE